MRILSTSKYVHDDIHLRTQEASVVLALTGVDVAHP